MIYPTLSAAADLAHFSHFRHLCPLCPFEPLHQPAKRPGIRQPRKLNSTKEYVRIYKLFMQNKPNFRNDKMNISTFIAMRYVNLDTGSGQKTNPIQTQFNPIQTQSQMLQDSPNDALREKQKSTLCPRPSVLRPLSPNEPKSVAEGFLGFFQKLPVKVLTNSGK